MACCHVDNGLAVSGAFDSEVKVSINTDDNWEEWKPVFAKKISSLENSITNHVAVVSATEIVVANNDSYVSEIDLNNGGDGSPVFKWNTAVNHVSVSPNKQLLCLSGDSCDISLVDRRSYTPVTHLRGHFDFSFCSSWNGDTFVCTGSQDGTCRVWDIRKPDKSVHCLGSILGAVRCAKYSPDGRWLVFSEPADFVHIYDTKSIGDCQVIDFFGNISGLAFSPDSSLLSVSVADTMFGCISDFQVSTLPFNTSKH
jgi:WD40 repeat protein